MGAAIWFVMLARALWMQDHHCHPLADAVPSGVVVGPAGVRVESPGSVISMRGIYMCDDHRFYNAQGFELDLRRYTGEFPIARKVPDHPCDMMREKCPRE